MLQNISMRDKGEFSDRVFISRRDATKGSRLSNEATVAQCLSELGFSEYALGRMALDDQVKLFSKAKFVVATHGAGLTNIIYMSGGNVLEIYTDDIFREHYFNLWQALA